MKKKALITATLVAFTLPALAAAADQYIEPGQWQQTIQISAASGKKMPPRTTTSCVKPEDTTNLRQAMLKNQPKECKVSHYDRDDDVVTWEVDCDNATKSKTKGKMTRTSSTSYEMEMDTSVEYGGKVSSTHITGKAHRLGACK